MTKEEYFNRQGTTVAEDYVSFETAKLLKEKGFNEPIQHFYKIDSKELYRGTVFTNTQIGDKFYNAPTLQMAMKWLREVHNIDINIDAAVGMLGVKVYVPLISTYKPLKDAPSKVHQIKRGIYYKDDKGVIPALQYFDSYEEAAEAAIKYCLENLI